MDITHDNVCSSMLSCFYSHLLSTGRPISSFCYSCVAKCFTPSLHKFTAYVLHKSLSGYMFDFILKNKIPATAKLPISLLLLVVEVWN